MLFERYQYDRKPEHRFVSHSMAKSIISLAVGMALAEGKIGSLDDKVSKYVPELAGYPYGETSIRNVLRMASGVAFKETYDGKDDLARFAQLRAQGRSRRCAPSRPRGAGGRRAFTMPPARRRSWRSLVRAVTGKPLANT